VTRAAVVVAVGEPAKCDDLYQIATAASSARKDAAVRARRPDDIAPDT
jgi:hypothetical protein